MGHLKTAFGDTGIHSVANRYEFNSAGEMTGQTQISGMGGSELTNGTPESILAHDPMAP